MAIDDYIDPTKPLSISNKEFQNMKEVYEVLRKQKEEERARIGVPQKKQLQRISSKKQQNSKTSTNPPTARRPGP